MKHISEDLKVEKIYSCSYEASQKAHNMLKYLIENSNHSKYIERMPML